MTRFEQDFVSHKSLWKTASPQVVSDYAMFSVTYIVSVNRDASLERLFQ
jgi:hypothetical protein